ncbi:MAG: imidazolonepropionase [Candidatus Hodarchaeota archaeon]
MERIHLDMVILNASELVTVAGASHAPKLKTDLGELGIIEDGAVAIRGNQIVAVDTTKDIRRLVKPGSKPRIIDASEKTVLPGFVDPHAHLAFAGSREQEFVQKIQGATYMEILEAGGGINVTVKATRKASRSTLVSLGQHVLDRMMEYGTTTVEGKSGYGLDPRHEYKQLLAIRDLNLIHHLDVIPTFMGAHVIPLKYKKTPEKYVELIISKMIPTVAGKGLAEFCDVFTEKGVFNLEQSKRILLAAKEKGLVPKIHADEMTTMGGAELAAEVGAVSADHLLKVSRRGIQALAKAQVIAVLLPATAFVIMAKDYAPARSLIDAGVPVALATDYNPNCLTESMQIVLTLACLNMRMTPAEVISAATINAAHAINRSHLIGSLEPNKQADLVIMDVPNHAHIPYHFGVNLVDKVVKAGKVVFSTHSRKKC